MNSYPKSNLKIALLLSIALSVIIVILPVDERIDEATPVSLEVAKGDPESNTPKSRQLEIYQTLPKDEKWIHLKIRSGDNLARIFQRENLTAADLQKILDLGEEVDSLRKILPGQELSLKVDRSGALLSIQYKKTALETMLINRHSTGFEAKWIRAEPERLVVFESSIITKQTPSLFHAGKAVGLSDNIIMKLSHIFQWDISFALDLRNGDSFSLMYEEIYIDGEKVKEGQIIAATFHNMGKIHMGVRYIDLAGRSDFYTPEGQSMRKAFIRDPVHFSYVSSSFNLRRLHPIHRNVMPHRGIDYAAKSGTPVIASGDGRVTTRRQNNSSGRYIVIQHGEKYTTKYLHLSAFARGIKPGAKVQQGQTIGYVGSSGWATGPHLHYEFLVNGVHRNPKTVSLPKAEPIAQAEMQRFKSQIRPLLAQLELYQTTGFARALESGSTGK